MSSPGFIEIKRFEEKDGIITPIELDAVPFQVKRVFFITRVPDGMIRGDHAHKTCHQFFVPIEGSFRLRADWYAGNSYYWESMLASADSKGFHAPPMTWMRLSHFTQKSSVLVLASEPYDTADYIHDFEEWKRAANSI